MVGLFEPVDKNKNDIDWRKVAAIAIPAAIALGAAAYFAWNARNSPHDTQKPGSYNLTVDPDFSYKPLVEYRV